MNKQESEQIFPYEIRKEIESYVCESDQFKTEYKHLDTIHLLSQFNDIAARPDVRSVLILTSRPFTNINNLNKAHQAVPIEKVIKGKWYMPMGEKQVIYNEEKLNEVKNTFNGPALISNILPPPDHLMGKFGHPSLQSGKHESWKDVIGKIEAMDHNLPSIFFNPITGLDKKSQRLEQERIKLLSKYMKKFTIDTLTSYEEPKKYPGGTMELYKRCFTLYFVKFVRDVYDSNKLKGYKVKWIADYTHKEKGWSKKSDKVTVKLDPYIVLIHESGMTFAGWKETSIKDQLNQYNAAKNVTN